MVKIKTLITRRFIERDHVKRLIEKSAEYITPDDIESILRERSDWSDYSIKFIPKSSGGWFTKVLDNDTDTEIKIDDLNPLAMDFYIRQLVDLTKETLKLQIEMNVAV